MCATGKHQKSLGWMSRSSRNVTGQDVRQEGEHQHARFCAGVAQGGQWVSFHGLNDPTALELTKLKLGTIQIYISTNTISLVRVSYLAKRFQCTCHRLSTVQLRTNESDARYSRKFRYRRTARKSGILRYGNNTHFRTTDLRYGNNPHFRTTDRRTFVYHTCCSNINTNPCKSRES